MLHLEELRLLVGVEQLLLQLGDFLHRLLLGLLQPAAQLEQQRHVKLKVRSQLDSSHVVCSTKRPELNGFYFN